MYFKSIPVVHPRVIELSRNARAFAISVGSGCGPAGFRAALPRARQGNAESALRFHLRESQ